MTGGHPKGQRAILVGGLGVIVCGTGLFKANIASMVGSL